VSLPMHEGCSYVQCLHTHTHTHAHAHTCTCMCLHSLLEKRPFWNLPGFEGPRTGSGTCCGEVAGAAGGGGGERSRPAQKNTFLSHEAQPGLPATHELMCGELQNSRQHRSLSSGPSSRGSISISAGNVEADPPNSRGLSVSCKG
jgi:hypothetical protein